MFTARYEKVLIYSVFLTAVIKGFTAHCTGQMASQPELCTLGDVVPVTH